MAVQDLAIPVVLSLHLFAWVLNLIAFGFLLRASLNCLNREASKKTRQYNCCGFLSVIHAIAFWCFVFYQYSSINFLFTTDFLFSRANMNCVAVTINAVSSFTLSKFTQYGFFIYRLYFVFKDSFFGMEPRQLYKAVAFLCFYVCGMLALSIFMSSQIASTQMSGQGRYRVCVREIGQPILVVIVVCWYGVFDTCLMVWVVSGFVSRLLKMADISNENTGMVQMYRLAFRSLVLFIFSIMTTMGTALFTMFLPDNLMWFFSPHSDLTLNFIAIVLSFQFADVGYQKLCGCMDFLVMKILVALYDDKIQVELVRNENQLSRMQGYVASATASKMNDKGQSSKSPSGVSTDKIEESKIQDII